MEEVSIGGVQAYRLAEVFDCAFIVPAAVLSDAPVVVSITVVGVHLQGLAVVLYSLLILPNLHQAKPASPHQQHSSTPVAMCCTVWLPSSRHQLQVAVADFKRSSKRPFAHK